MKKIRWIIFGICGLMTFVPHESFADYGEDFLVVRCDGKAGIFEVEPRIIWNEALAELQPSLKEGSGKIRRGDEQIFNVGMIGQGVEARCEWAGMAFKAVVDSPYSPKLQVFQNDQLILSLTVDDVWNFYGYVFKVRYTSTIGWEELCGRDESEKNWHTLDRKRTDTNCREPLKQMPNHLLQPTSALTRLRG